MIELSGQSIVCEGLQRFLLKVISFNLFRCTGIKENFRLVSFRWNVYIFIELNLPCRTGSRSRRALWS
jgi:hypothetical protein